MRCHGTKLMTILNRIVQNQSCPIRFHGFHGKELPRRLGQSGRDCALLRCRGWNHIPTSNDRSRNIDYLFNAMGFILIIKPLVQVATIVNWQESIKIFFFHALALLYCRGWITLQLSIKSKANRFHHFQQSKTLYIRK